MTSPTTPDAVADAAAPAGAPDVVRRYFEASARGEVPAIVACFTPEATVLDEGHTHVGHAAIEAWRSGPVSAFTYTTTFTSSAPRPGGHRVEVVLEGDFPGGRAELVQDFDLDGGLISGLRITPPA